MIRKGRSRILLTADASRKILVECETGVIVLDGGGVVVLWNDWIARSSRVPAEKAVGKRLQDIFPELETSRLTIAMNTALKRRQAARLSQLLNTALLPLFSPLDGAPIKQSVVVKPIRKGRAVSHVLIQVSDVSRAYRREEILRSQAAAMEQLAESYRQSELQARAVIDSALDGIVVFDESGTIVTFNPAAERVFLCPADQAVGSPVHRFIHLPDRQAASESTPRDNGWIAAGQENVPRECRGRTAAGDEIILEIGTGLTCIEGANRYVVTARDITQRKEADARIEYLAHFDPLTSLPNRALFKERLDRAVLQARRTGSKLGLLMLDLDHFKEINDTFGHHVGDLLLVAAARRICKVIRESDTAARLGGDEFAILLTNLGREADAGVVAESIVMSLSQPFGLEGREIRAGASVGVALFPGDGEHADGLMRNADLALYRGKAEGRGVYRFFVPEMNARVQAQRTIEKELQQALLKGGLVLDFQPIVDMRSGRMRGVEALLRWEHETRGRLPASEFLQFISRTEVMIPLGHWVLRDACRTFRPWINRGGPDFRIAINLSSAELRQRHLPDTIMRVLENTGMPPHNLQLELSASVYATAVKNDGDGIDALRELGVTFALDDFGADDAPISQIRDHPVERIKIAPRYLASSPDRLPESAALLRAMVALGRGLGARVVAEGVETEIQYEMAREAEVDEAQGYLIGRPMAPESLLALIEKEHASLH